MSASSRTRKACDLCHRRKIKCDLGAGLHPCTNCRLGALTCRPHERRRPGYLSTGNPSAQSQNARHSELILEDPITPIPNERESNKASTQRFQNAAEADNRARLSFPPHVGPQDSPDIEAALDTFAGTAQRGIHESPEYVAATESHVGRSNYLGSSEVRFHEEMIQVRNDTSRLSRTDFELLQVQKAFELPQRSVLASLIDSYFKYCSPWTPVLEPSVVEELQSTGSSPLLLNALLLAGSRVTSSNILSASAEDFYCKARLLFVLGHERDALTSIIAVTLLQWYNPTGPEHISTSTSGFWVRIAAGLAYQIGLHREPIAQKDRSLRRRLWWSIVCRDDVISVGTGRPRTINLDDSDVAPPTTDDFPVEDTRARLFVAFSDIVRLLADLTENIRRKTMTGMIRTRLENALYRWIKDLPTEFHLFYGSPKRLSPYNFETRQLLVPYFVVLFILSRHSAVRNQSVSVSFVASSFVAGIFEDLLNRDELCHCGPVFTFYAFAAGLAQMPALRYSSLAETAEESLSIIQLSLTEMKKRWGSAEGALAALDEMKRLTLQIPTLGDAPGQELAKFTPFFDDFGPELCKQYHLLKQNGPISEALPIPSSSFSHVDSRHRGLEHGLESPANMVDHNQTSRLQSITAEHADPMFIGQSNPFFSDLNPFGSWMDDLGLGLASY